MIRQQAETAFEGALTPRGAPLERAEGSAHPHSRRGVAMGVGGSAVLMASSAPREEGSKLSAARPERQRGRVPSRQPVAERSVRASHAADEARWEAAPFRRRHFSSSLLPLSGLSASEESSHAALSLSPPPANKRAPPRNKHGGSALSLANVIEVAAASSVVGAGPAVAAPINTRKAGTPREARMLAAGGNATPRQATGPPPVTDNAKQPPLGSMFSLGRSTVTRVLSPAPAALARYGPLSVSSIKRAYSRGEESSPRIPGMQNTQARNRSGLLSVGVVAPSPRESAADRTSAQQPAGRLRSPPGALRNDGGGSVRPLQQLRRPAPLKSASAFESAADPGAETPSPRRRARDGAHVAPTPPARSAATSQRPGRLAQSSRSFCAVQGGLGTPAADKSQVGAISAGPLGPRRGLPVVRSASALPFSSGRTLPQRKALVAAEAGALEARSRPRAQPTVASDASMLPADAAELSVTALLMAFLFVSHAVPGEKVCLLPSSTRWTCPGRRHRD
jgi:hypothetical protein